ncbi:MAG: pyridoxal-phosphate dependent enzyme, partial [Candidatus Odinarchaeota archaeon]
LHHTIIGLDAKKQFEMIGEYPDIVVSCIGGGSNFAGFSFPFIADKLAGKREVRAIAVEPTACPSVTRGPYSYDFGDTAMTTPLLKMFTLGHSFKPPAIHAGGLRYHGAAPTVSLLRNEGFIKSVAYPQEQIYQCAKLFAETEGLIPAPETSHAICAAIDLAKEAKKRNEKKVIVFNYSGHGLLDIEGYRMVLKLD